MSRFATESNTKTVTGRNLHPKLESSYTTVPQHFSTAALAVLPPYGICMADDLWFWCLKPCVWRTHTQDWWAHKTPGTWGLYLAYVIHGCMAILYIPYCRKTIDYYTVMLHMIWFSNIQVFSCAFYLHWNQSTCLFPYFATCFQPEKTSFFATWSPTLIDTQWQAFWK